MSVDTLLPISKTPETPLQILQADLEAILQLISYTMHLYEGVTVSVRPSLSVPLNELGWDKALCNMGLVNAVAALDAFKSNVIRNVRAQARQYGKREFESAFKSSRGYAHITEPLARRDAITHNHGKADQEYVRRMKNPTVQIGSGLDCDLAYLRGASRHFFECALEVTDGLVRAGFLGNDHRHPIGGFQDGSRI